MSRFSKIYLEGSRVGWEDVDRFHVTDLRLGKILMLNRSTKTAKIEEFKANPGGSFVVGGNPLDDLIRLKDAPAQRLPDERVGDTLCHVYRVNDAAVAFIGAKVPWVKVWLNPETRLPMRVHYVVGDSLAMTLDDFRWNEPFDKKLLTLDVPEGYTLEESKREEKPGSAAPADNLEPIEADQSINKLGGAIPTDEIAETLDMLADRIEANYRKIRSWSGTFDVREFFRSGASPPVREYDACRGAVLHGARRGPAASRLQDGRTDTHGRRRAGRSVTGVAVGFGRRRSCTASPSASRTLGSTASRGLWISIRASLLVFFSANRRGAAERYAFDRFVNPLTFFGVGRPYWKKCRENAKLLRGEIHPELLEYARKNVTLRKLPKGRRRRIPFLPNGSSRLSQE